MYTAYRSRLILLVSETPRDSPSFLDRKVNVVKRHNHRNQEILEVSGGIERSRKVLKRYLRC